LQFTGYEFNSSAALFAWPNSDDRLDCATHNVPGTTSLPDYAATRDWSHPVVFTDIGAKLDSIGRPSQSETLRLMSIWNTLNLRFKNIILGTYLSGLSARKPLQQETEFPEALNYYAFPSESYLFFSNGQDVFLPYDEQGYSYTDTNGNTVDSPPPNRALYNLDDPSVRSSVSSAYVNEVKRRRSIAGPQLQVVLMDNIITHQYTLGTTPSGTTLRAAAWTNTVDYLSRISPTLHLLGIRLFVNLSVQWSTMTATQLHAFAGAADGVGTEQPLHPTIRTSDRDLRAEIANVRLLLDRGLLVSFMATYPSSFGTRFDQEYVLAAYAMIVRHRGHSLCVTRPAFDYPDGWEEWPQLLGKARGDYQISVSPSDPRYFLLSRRFERGTLSLDLARTMSAATARAAVTLSP
jgi:hypothetical protein